MIVFSLLSLFLATHAFGQAIVYDSAHNVTTIVGTWSSGSQNVVTGMVSPPDNPLFFRVVHMHTPTELRATRQRIVHLPNYNWHVLFIVS
ncbi:hypothetical protein J3R83DRAFT_13287 [Lanmaoa asiatica]|nr:hypothetical protein J3R83DRAFT_13287 [Lanmaoa asiatica]